MEKPEKFFVATAADEIRRQLGEEPGMADLKLEVGRSGEWALIGEVASEELRKKAWAIFYGERGNNVKEKTWDFVRVKQDSSATTAPAVES